MCAAAGHGDCSCFGVGVHGKFTIFLSECQDFLFWGLLWSFFMEEVVGGRSLGHFTSQTCRLSHEKVGKHKHFTM